MKTDTPENLMKSVLLSAMDHFSISSMIDMLEEISTPDQEEEIKDKCKDLLTINGGIFVAETNLANESGLKEYCKNNDIKLKGYYD